MAAGLTLAVVFISGTREQEKSIWTAFYIPPPPPPTCYETQLYDAFSLVVKLPAYEECGEGEED